MRTLAKRFYRVIGMLPLALPLALGAQTRTNEDARTLVPVSAQTRQSVLVEMRDFLFSTHQILKSANEGNMQAVAAAARHVGLSHFAQSASDPALAVYRVGGAAPDRFRQLAAQVHAGFDRIAEAAENGGRAAAVHAALAENLGRCVACHAAYKFPAIEPEPKTSLPRTVLNPPHRDQR